MPYFNACAVEISPESCPCHIWAYIFQELRQPDENHGDGLVLVSMIEKVLCLNFTFLIIHQFHVQIIELFETSTITTGSLIIGTPNLFPFLSYMHLYLQTPNLPHTSRVLVIEQIRQLFPSFSYSIPLITPDSVIFCRIKPQILPLCRLDQRTVTRECQLHTLFNNTQLERTTHSQS